MKGPEDEKNVMSPARFSMVAIDDRTSDRGVLDRYIRPEKPVSDYMTPVSGVKAVHLDGVVYSIRDVHKDMLRWFGPDKILVVHDGGNDMKQLKVLSRLTIDTGVLFQHPFFGNRCKPSLEYLTKAFLGDKMDRDGGHCPIDDAQATGRLVHLMLKYGTQHVHAS